MFIISGNIVVRSVFIFIFVFFISACEQESKLAQKPDYVLAERHAYCLDRKPTAPGHATACENVRIECERRKKELGSYICRHN